MPYSARARRVYERKHYATPEGRHLAWAKRLRYRSGIGLAQYEEMLAAQDGRCAICRRRAEECARDDRRLVVDHDHRCCPGKRSCGKCVRHLLCTPCNLMLGYAGDDPHVLATAIAYLAEHE